MRVLLSINFVQAKKSLFGADVAGTGFVKWLTHILSFGLLQRKSARVFLLRAKQRLSRWVISSPLLTNGSSFTASSKPIQKAPQWDAFCIILVAGTGFEPRDLQVMSLTSYQTAPPRDKTSSLFKR